MRAKYTHRTNLTVRSMCISPRRGGRRHQKGGEKMKGVSFVQHTKLTNVAGRIRYISSEEEQEYLYAVYDTAPEGFWQDLARENQRDYKRSGTSGQCIEARELIIALPKVYYRNDPPHQDVLEYFVDNFKEKYDVE